MRTMKRKRHLGVFLVSVALFTVAGCTQSRTINPQQKWRLVQADDNPPGTGVTDGEFSAPRFRRVPPIDPVDRQAHAD